MKFKATLHASRIFKSTSQTGTLKKHRKSWKTEYEQVKNEQPLESFHKRNEFENETHF